MAKKKAASKKARTKVRARERKKYSGGEFRSSGIIKSALIDGITFARRPVSYSEVDGLAIFEGLVRVRRPETEHAASGQVAQTAEQHFEKIVMESSRPRRAHARRQARLHGAGRPVFGEDS